MSALAQAVALIKRWEGCKLVAYPDPGSGGDPWTIGYGATGRDIKPGVRWTQAQADDRLALDVARFLRGVESVLSREATETQLGAMASLAYNIGVKAFTGSTLLQKFNSGDIAGAAGQFLRWNRSGGKPMRGLTNRRTDERRVFLSSADGNPK